MMNAIRTIRLTTAVALANALRAVSIEHGAIQPDGSSTPDIEGVRRGAASDEARAALAQYDAEVGIAGPSGTVAIAGECSVSTAAALAESLAWALPHAETAVLTNPSVKGNPESLKQVVKLLDAARAALVSHGKEAAGEPAAVPDAGFVDDFAAVLKQALPLVDKLREISGGEGDVVAMNARALLKRYESAAPASGSAVQRPDRPCDADCARRAVSSAECTCTRAEGQPEGEGGGKILVSGNPVDGFAFYGPFEDDEAAAQAGDDLEPDWWIAPLRSPDAIGTVYVAVSDAA